MESVQPPAGSQTSHVPAQRTPPVQPGTEQVPAPGTEPLAAPATEQGAAPATEQGAAPATEQGAAPATEQVAGPGAPPAQRAHPAPVHPVPARRSRKRIVLAVLGGVLALLIMGTGALAFLYDRATAPDRSAPDVVVDNYLRAYLVDRNDVLARQFVCPGSADLAAVQALRAETERREAQFKVVVRVSWGPLQRSKTATGETVRTTLTIRSFAGGQDRAGRREDWAFDLVDDDGWRVCATRKES